MTINTHWFPIDTDDPVADVEPGLHRGPLVFHWLDENRVHRFLDGGPSRVSSVLGRVDDEVSECEAEAIVLPLYPQLPGAGLGVGGRLRGDAGLSPLPPVGIGADTGHLPTTAATSDSVAPVARAQSVGIFL